jgi:putative colanic acid biosynthesis acetyltransferase WcaF
MVNRTYSKREYALWGLWKLASIVFWLTPRHCYGLRNSLLRAFGAKLGRGVKIYPSCRIQFPWNLECGDHVVLAWGVNIYNLGLVKIGSQVVVSQYAHLCAGTHDYQATGFPLKKSPITIGDYVWIAADAFVGPNVQVASHVVIGARAVVTKSTEANCLYVGNPAQAVKRIEGMAGLN